jgi:predicted amidohydrolase YtcJ
MKAARTLVLFLVATCGIIAGAHAQRQTAEVVYTNGKIYTVNEAQPWAEAVAIADGGFIAVGTSDEVETVTDGDTKVIDLGGKFAMPGLHDTHVHMEQSYKGDILGEALLTFPEEETSIKKLQELLKDYADKNRDLKVLFAQNLQQGLFPNATPTKAFIDEVVPDRPVVILSDSEHEGLLNTKALEMEGITAETESPEGGEIDKDPKTGEPTGWLKETAAGTWAWKHYPQVSPEDHKRGLQATIAYLNSIGVTSVKQQHAKNPIAIAAQSLEKDGALHARVGLSWTYKGPLEPMPLDEQEKMIAERGRFASDLIKTDYVKLSGDGNAGTTGYVLDPYLVTGDKGIAFFTDDALFAEVEKFDRMGLGVTIHVTGDAANRQMIDAVERVKKKHGELKARHQLGHASLVHPDDYARLKDLDITAEFSPVVWFSTGFVEAQREQLGEERMSRWYPMKSIIDNGGRIVIASDGPLMWQEPFPRMEGAITRKAPGGGGEPLAPSEALDLAAAIKAMTLDSAYLMNIEESVGSIEVGKRADMIVLDKNLFDISVDEIDSAKVRLTIFDGGVVYDAVSDPTGENEIEKRHGIELDFSGTTGHPGCEWHPTQSHRSP